MSVVLDVQNLTKRYDQLLAVDHVSFQLQRGEILGLLGPNGAGKSSIIQMLLGLTTPDSGQIKYFGQDFNQHQTSIFQRINFASTYNQLQGKLTVKQNLQIYAGLFGVTNPQSRIDELLTILGIDHVSNTTFWKLSSGQRTRAILAKALINKPELLLLDEPTASLDPDIIKTIIELIKRLQVEEQVSILFTSHNMEEVTRLCDRVMFLRQGKVLVTDTPLGLTKRLGRVELVLTVDADQQQLAAAVDELSLTAQIDDQRTVRIQTTEEEVPAVLFDLKKTGLWVTDIDIQKPTLEDVFVSIARGDDDQRFEN